MHAGGSFTILYRDPDRVPGPLRLLWESQRGSLTAINNQSQDALVGNLRNLVTEAPAPEGLPDYTLTLDNVLKMALILQRAQAHLPIIIMGESGIGKTSLLKYLCAVTGVQLHVLPIHAGTTVASITSFVDEVLAAAQGDRALPHYAFLDEINTCDHLGVFYQLLVERRYRGQDLPDNVAFLAACNPYAKRPRAQLTSGLTGKAGLDPLAGLKYRVHPLPEAMLTYVWDYGSLTPEDERSYIVSMLRTLPAAYGERAEGSYHAVLTDLVCAAHAYLRGFGDEFVVSLRDVSRFIKLVNFFHGWKETRITKKLNKARWSDVRFYPIHELAAWKVATVALAVTYMMRLMEDDARGRLLEGLAHVFRRHGSAGMTPDAMRAVLHFEQRDLMERMDLEQHPNLAWNAALLENVFCLTVCVLNCIPVFLVGKPGNSKTVATSILNSSLRGRGSKDELLRNYPGIQIFPYQGSEDSTAAGIEATFEKARRYMQQGDQLESVLPLVLLDEIGLAEQSRFNPLKVLHPLLEPTMHGQPEIHLIGVSN
jgi:hypothetical protein